MQKTSWFTHFAKKTAQVSGRPATFGLALGTILAWLITGPLFEFSNTWQLVINTGTTIVTFLMVFLIQNTQNRDTAAIQIKLHDLHREPRRRGLPERPGEKHREDCCGVVHWATGGNPAQFEFEGGNP